MEDEEEEDEAGRVFATKTQRWLRRGRAKPQALHQGGGIAADPGPEAGQPHGRVAVGWGEVGPGRTQAAAPRPRPHSGAAIPNRSLCSGKATSSSHSVWPSPAQRGNSAILPPGGSGEAAGVRTAPVLRGVRSSRGSCPRRGSSCSNGRTRLQLHRPQPGLGDGAATAGRDRGDEDREQRRQRRQRALCAAEDDAGSCRGNPLGSEVPV